MKYFHIFYLTVLSVVLMSIPGIANEQQPAVLESISYQHDAEHGETINFKLNGTHIPKIFAIKGEKPRVVFDFMDTKYSDLINKLIETEGDLVKRVRVGLHNDPTPKTRVVVDLAPQSDFTYEHDFIVQDNVLTISIFENSPLQEKLAKEANAKEETQVKSTEDEAIVEKSEVAAVPVIKKEENKQVVSKPADVNSEDIVSVEDKKEVGVAIDDSATKEESDIANYPTADEVFGNTEGETTDTQKAKSEIAAANVEPAVQPSTKEEIDSNPTLLDITFEDSSNKGEMVLFKLNDFYPPIVFGIEKGNPRVVCDFLDTQIAEAVKLTLETKGVYIQQVRTAKHANPDKVRVVLDLVPNKNYDLQQVFFKEDNLFVIIVNSFDEDVPPQSSDN